MRGGVVCLVGRHWISAWAAPSPERRREPAGNRRQLPRSLDRQASWKELVDFSLINERTNRFSVGAVNVLTGNFVYFDNAKEEIEPEHIMASGALPPALPMIKIGTDYFWDGGIVSNTPPWLSSPRQLTAGALRVRHRFCGLRKSSPFQILISLVAGQPQAASAIAGYIPLTRKRFAPGNKR